VANLNPSFNSALHKMTPTKTLFSTLVTGCKPHYNPGPITITWRISKTPTVFSAVHPKAFRVGGTLNGTMTKPYRDPWRSFGAYVPSRSWLSSHSWILSKLFSSPPNRALPGSSTTFAIKGSQRELKNRENWSCVTKTRVEKDVCTLGTLSQLNTHLRQD
jgi:hypothetical protein